MLSTLIGILRDLRRAPSLFLGVILLAGCGADPIGSTPETASRGASPAVAATAQTIEFGNFALYLPADAPAPRAILVALGGPDTRGFVTGAPFGAPFPPVEAGLQAQGAQFRELAGQHKIAILGTSLAGLPNSAASDQLLRDAIQQAAAASGHPELTNLPLLLYGISGGGPQASGFAARNPGQVVGLVLKVPATVASVGGGPAAAVPTLVLLAQFDIFIDNAAITQAFLANRAAGAYWGLVTEPGAPHFTVSLAHRQLTVDWMADILGLRLRGASGQPFRPLDPTSGWLGDPVTGSLVPSGSFQGDRGATSWLPSREIAQQWRVFGGYGS